MMGARLARGAARRPRRRVPAVRRPVGRADHTRSCPAAEIVRARRRRRPKPPGACAMKVARDRRRRHPRADPGARARRDRAPHADAAPASSFDLDRRDLDRRASSPARSTKPRAAAGERDRDASTSTRGRRSSTARCSSGSPRVGGLHRRALRRPTGLRDVAASGYLGEHRLADAKPRDPADRLRHSRRRDRAAPAHRRRHSSMVDAAHAQLGRARPTSSRSRVGDARRWSTAACSPPTRRCARTPRSTASSTSCVSLGHGEHTRAAAVREGQGLGPARSGIADRRSTSSSTAPPTPSTMPARRR